MIEHTPGEMKVTARWTTRDSFLVVPSQEPSGKDITGNCYLITNAREVPHECADPQCPGNVTRRKLKAFDGLLAFVEKVMSRGHATDCDPWPEKSCTCLTDEAATLIAKAKE